MLNGYCLNIIKNIKKNVKNKKNKALNLIKELFKNLWFIPGILILMWISFSLFIDCVFLFIKYISKSRDGNDSNQQDNVISSFSLSNIIQKHLYKDIYILLLVSILNLIILCTISLFMISNKKDNDINDNDIDNIFKIYMLSFILSLLFVYYYIKNK
tara:strand:+ start:1979 stop:2449 length:471 start_codon:yes stop_codon:yes gene_type:complete